VHWNSIGKKSIFLKTNKILWVLFETIHSDLQSPTLLTSRSASLVIFQLQRATWLNYFKYFHRVSGELLLYYLETPYTFFPRIHSHSIIRHPQVGILFIWAILVHALQQLKYSIDDSTVQSKKSRCHAVRFLLLRQPRALAIHKMSSQP